MPQVNYYLKKEEPSTKRSLIYLQFKYHGQRLVFAFGQTISKRNWSPAKQRVKSNNQTTEDGQSSLNDLLDNLEKVLIQAYNTEMASGIPTPVTLKQHLVSFLHQNDQQEDAPTLFKLIKRFVSGEIKHKGRDKTEGTLRKYKTAYNCLMEFQAAYRYPVDFETINLEFFYKYVSFLKSRGLMQNTISKQIDHVKTFMNEAFDLKYTRNVEHKSKKFSAATEETDAVHLDEKELQHLFKFKLSSSKLEHVRDLFIFGSYTGLRFSDYSDIKKENIIKIDGEQFVKVITKKTRAIAIIPCSPTVLQIFEKYKDSPNRLPKTISGQKFNEYIKEACREAGMTERGRLTTAPDLQLCDCVSSHTARRSFATNLYLEGFPTIEIMKITGHTTERSFLIYIKVSKLDAAKKLSKHIQLKWNEKLLKAV